MVKKHDHTDHHAGDLRPASRKLDEQATPTDSDIAAKFTDCTADDGEIFGEECHPKQRQQVNGMAITSVQKVAVNCTLRIAASSNE